MIFAREFNTATLLRAAFEMHQQLIRVGAAKPWDYPELDYSHVLDVWPTYHEDIKRQGADDVARHRRQWEQDNPPEARPPAKPTDWAALHSKPAPTLQTTDWVAFNSRAPKGPADGP